MKKEKGIVSNEPSEPHGYTMDELLSASDYSQPQPDEEPEWVDAPGGNQDF